MRPSADTGGEGDAVACVFDVQRFSVHDGAGLRTTVFFKGCPLRCAWCQNPESLRPEPEMALLADRCRRSRECAGACPSGAISFATGGGSVRLDRGRCDACGECVRACAFGAWWTVGRRVSVGTLADEVERDRRFYESSGGGVTLSGGEPTFQMTAAAALAARCRERGLSVGLQTCGAFLWEDFAPHADLFDFVQFDLKLADREEHRRLTGADNRAIFDNAKRLLKAGAAVEFRMPVVPGLTDGVDNLDGLADWLDALGVRSLELIEYHPMGKHKLRWLEPPIAPLDRLDGADALARRSLARAAAHLRRRGVQVRP
jgi:pyruvate formate lyase activating enzyme